jgi:HemY protein
MRWLVWILLILSSAVGLALLMRFNHGNVAVLWPPYRVDFSVNLAVLVLVLSFLVFHLLLVALSKALALPSRVRGYRQRRQHEGARVALRDGVLALFEGRFGRAERLAQAAREDDLLAGPAALVAARAAHRMREFDRRDRWLDLAEVDPGSAHAGLMTAAELALEEQDPLRAIAAIERLHGKGLRHIHSLRVALRAYEQSEDWARVLQVLRQLEKRDALPPAAVRGLRVRACRALFARSAGDAAGVRELWSSLRAAERELPETVEAAAAAHAASGDQGAARRLIEQAGAAEFSPMLLPLYAALDAVPARERIQRAEQWRMSHGDDPDLLLALGRMCMSESLWGKAEEYLERSLQARASVAAHVALGELSEALSRPDAAASHFRSAARLADQGQRPGSFSRQAGLRPDASPAGTNLV